MSDHGSKLTSRCWFYRGRKTGESGEEPSKHRRDQLQQHYSHEFQVFENQYRAIPKAVTHSSTDPVQQSLRGIRSLDLRRQPQRRRPSKQKNCSSKQRERIISSPNGLINNALEQRQRRHFHVLRTTWTRGEMKSIFKIDFNTDTKIVLTVLKRFRGHKTNFKYQIW